MNDFLIKEVIHKPPWKGIYKDLIGYPMPGLTITAEISPILLVELQPGTEHSWKWSVIKRLLKSWKQAAAHPGQQG